MEILKEKIPKHIFQRIETADIYSLDYFLIKSKYEICDKTKLSIRDVTNVINVVSKIILNHNFTTAFELKSQENNWKTLKIGDPIIDKTINGISTRGITEVYGESGSGKTQLCLQLALQVQKLEKFGGLNAGAIYICTEDSFPSKRLQQMCEFLPKSSKENQDKNFSDEIFIEHIQDIDQLKYCINLRVPVLLSKTQIKLIIIDSIAAVFRYDNETCDYISRTEDLRTLTNKLNSISLHNNVAIVCVNQVTSDPKIGEKPCLGLSWSNLIRSRIRLIRTNVNISYNNQILPKRNIKIVFSPETNANQCSFVIIASGLLGFQ